MITDITVDWAEPPDNSRGPGRGSSPEQVAVAAALRQQPDQWARIAVADTLPQAQSFAARIRRGLNAAFRPGGHFHAVAREDGDGKSHVFARYVGHRDPDPVEELSKSQPLSELRDMAKGYGLSAAGTKYDIAARILDYVGPGGEV